MDAKKLWRMAAVAAAAAVFAALIYALKNALIPVGIAIILAYLLDPVIDRLEARKINRAVGIFILAGIIFISVTVIGSFLIFQGQRELVRMYHNLPGYLETSKDKAAPLIKKYTGYELPQTFGEFMEEAQAQIANIDTAALKPVSTVLKNISSSTLAIVGWTLGLLIIPVFLFYFLRDWDKMRIGAVDYIPYSYRDYVVDKAKKIDVILGAFIRGQLTVCVVLGVLYSLGLMAVGIDLAVVIGMAAGLLFIVPYLGTVIGVAAATVMALLAYGLSWHLLGVWAVFGVVQLFEGMVLTPKVMGDKVGLSPVVVIFALLVGSDLLGLLGMLIAVPAAAVIKVFVDEAVQKYRESDFFLEKNRGSEKK